MDTRVQWDTESQEVMLCAIRRACGIAGYEAFLRWLREDVAHVLPHEVLVVAWGDFPRCRLRYDVAVSLAERRAPSPMQRTLALDALMRSLHRRWLDDGGCWTQLHGLEALMPAGQAADALPWGLRQMCCVLVSGIRDLRGGQDCVYAFFARGQFNLVPPHVPGMLLPHMDWVLRSIGFPHRTEDAVRQAGCPRAPLGMSRREQEIMHWVRNGKTNPEIGIILNISPNTVKNHLKRIFRKMQVSTRAQAVARYVENPSGHVVAVRGH